MATRGMIYVGTSGWNYQHWRGVFYPPDIKDADMLGYISKRLPTIEINNTFYHLPRATSIARWRDTAPGNFVFSVKASRFITHAKRLVDTEEAVKTFLNLAKGLGDRLGPILFQLPPGFKPDMGRISSFIDALPREFRYAFEFRNPGWETEEVYALLEKNNMAFCISDLAGHFSPVKLTAGFAYLRLHGPAGAYAGKYDDRFLEEWAGTFLRWSEEGHVYCYFDNDMWGYAVENALRMNEMITGMLDARYKISGF